MPEFDDSEPGRRATRKKILVERLAVLDHRLVSAATRAAYVSGYLGHVPSHQLLGAMEYAYFDFDVPHSPYERPCFPVDVRNVAAAFADHDDPADAVHVAAGSSTTCHTKLLRRVGKLRAASSRGTRCRRCAAHLGLPWHPRQRARAGGDRRPDRDGETAAQLSYS